ncbi:RABE1-like protein [Mya arenaria]|uniref:RABE1-like protein n=1 Tax=Mya arenaria TaxID=6604 RepID=A0ABY7E2E3_MYAAR|nr:RABE1-like protein [Mya arenaria]
MSEIDEYGPMASAAELKDCRDEVERMSEELVLARGELADINAAVSISETNKEEEISKIRQQCQQEVETMQALLRDAAEEASSSTAAQYESERAKLHELNENYEEEIQSIRSRLSQERTLDKGKSFLSSVADIVSRGTSSLGAHSDANTLEDSMKKAQQDAEILKSVLQERLVSADTGELPTSPVKTTSLPSLDEITNPEEKIEKLIKYLKAEKASRTDLEMFVAVINTQKTAMQDENDKLREELSEVCSILDEEKRGHSQLKETWQMANDQFLESQRLMMMDMRRMEGLLSAEQQRLLAEQQKKDQEREAQERKVKELEEARKRQQQEASLQANIDAAKKVEEATKKLRKKDPKLLDLSRDHSVSNTSINSTASLDSFAFDDSSLAEPIPASLKKSHSNSEIASLSEQDLIDGGAHETRSLNEADNLTIRISPEKVINLPSLTEAQNEARKSLVASAKLKQEGVSLEGRRLVSDREWSLLQEELRGAREKLGRPCDMCNNYEAQLQGVQDEFRQEQASFRALERESHAQKQTIDSQKQYVSELEEKLRTAAHEQIEEISVMSHKTKECERYISELRQQTTNTHMELQDQMREMSSQREVVQRELDMQLLLLKYREEIIAAKVALEHAEETLKSEILFLKDRVVSEQQEKATMEETLTQEISTLQEKLAIQDSLTSELERESSVRAETEGRLRETEQSIRSHQAKSKQIIGGLQKQVEEQSNARTQLEQDVYRMKQKVLSLQTDLDNSEAVQRDFVKLSQSLQIQLEQIRQAENEVRWQHEEDVDDCAGCRQQFSVTKRKHHCRHCGRIFCTDCITKTVKTGPKQRPARVCDVCHTILVKDATPYFSTELPSTPD